MITNKNDIQSEIKNLYRTISTKYDNQDGHRLDDMEKKIWEDKIFDRYLSGDMKHILDVGSGTGLLTTFIFDLKLSSKITGLEYSEEMIKVAQQKNYNSIEYKKGDTHEPKIFKNDAFDCIVSRQVVCHFYDPLVVFNNWYNWLEEDGYVIVVDQLWLREDWSNNNLVDNLPLSCIQTKATLEYLLNKSGFEIIENDFLYGYNNKYLLVAKK